MNRYLTCLLISLFFSNLSSYPITRMERGDRGHWWILYFIYFVIQARLQLSPLIFQELYESNIPCSGLNPWGLFTAKSFAFEDTSTKEGHMGLRPFVANSSTFPRKHSFQRQSSRRRSSRVTEFIQRNTTTRLLVWFFQGDTKYLHLLRRTPYKQNSVILQCAIKKNVTVLLYPALWGRQIRHNFGILIDEKIESLTV